MSAAETLNKIFRVYTDGHKEELMSLGDPVGNTLDQQLRLIDCASVLRAPSFESTAMENTSFSWIVSKEKIQQPQ